jgi:hypothetical protein
VTHGRVRRAADEAVAADKGEPFEECEERDRSVRGRERCGVVAQSCHTLRLLRARDRSGHTQPFRLGGCWLTQTRDFPRSVYEDPKGHRPALAVWNVEASAADSPTQAVLI